MLPLLLGAVLPACGEGKLSSWMVFVANHASHPTNTWLGQSLQVGVGGIWDKGVWDCAVSVADGKFQMNASGERHLLERSFMLMQAQRNAWGGC